MAKYVVTSAWPYVNHVPHLGTLIGSVLSADIYARYLRLRGRQVVFVSGSDEHGTPIELEARKKGVHPKELTDQVHEYDVKMWREYRISFDNYSRTESPVHKEFVMEFMKKLEENGYIFSQEEVLPYCERDKIFLPDRFVEGTCPYCGYEKARGDQCDECGRLLHPTELKNPRCALCGSKPVYKSTRHWFIDLRRVQDRLLKWLESHGELQDSVKKYSINWVAQGLKPRSVTRDLSWGVPAPFKGAEGKTIYVWFDALLGYVSATKELFIMRRGDPEEWKSWWWDSGTRTVYFIGKDNIPFHAIILPALFLASHDPYVLPWRISATEYLMYEGQQFSKSRRIGVWIDEALEIAPADYWRWALARMRPEARDTNFTWKEFYRIVNTELNDDIGNFVNRVLSLVRSRMSGVAPEPEDLGEHQGFVERVRRAAWAVAEDLEAIRIKRATEGILEIAREGNAYLNRTQPWKLLSQDREEGVRALSAALYAVKTLAHLLAPFTPDAADRLWSMLGLAGSVHEAVWDEWLDRPLPGGARIVRVEPLFQKLPDDFLERVDEIVEDARRRAREKRPPLLRD
ncbi:methionyl-tRNA synthetase [Aeropyrum pernix K1]|uniref:Methionine--tRNA ligase n=1 Tax=Aeropyrum pernix (strain ATCC 700893 / DSM 11879 / JCM 9820 / NBRC 100138 / K1) TaxID=272557 RepID=SYM_AERPE|nr:methionine--tRNA ligase [Aeropyrum pernix]Q9YCY3.1 RecName: Full=Methionine--tRNA ligase; AltName: Full=Methionyl-tRNA synthetase; Short=MetRS [Aeropyrum pernix K1]BAA80114.1 methionyl-tRNA synthetase [Aeropyrum pernix K1]